MRFNTRWKESWAGFWGAQKPVPAASPTPPTTQEVTDLLQSLPDISEKVEIVWNLSYFSYLPELITSLQYLQCRKYTREYILQLNKTVMDRSKETTSYKSDSAQSAWIFHELQVFARLIDNLSNFSFSRLFHVNYFTSNAREWLLKPPAEKRVEADCGSGWAVVKFHFTRYKAVDVLLNITWCLFFCGSRWHALKADTLFARGPAFLQGGWIWLVAVQFVPGKAQTGDTACLLWLLCILPIIWALCAKHVSMKQRSHSLAFRKVFADQMRLKRNEKRRNCFGHTLEKPKYCDFFGIKGLEFLPIAGHFKAPLTISKNLIISQNGHFEQCQLELSWVTSTNNCLPGTTRGDKHRQIIFIRTASPFSFRCSVTQCSSPSYSCIPDFVIGCSCVNMSIKNKSPSESACGSKY